MRGNCRMNFVRHHNTLEACFKVVNLLSCFYLLLFENTEMRPCTWCVLPRCDSSSFETMLEFMRRHSLAKGVIHFSVICILVTDQTFNVRCLICRRNMPHAVRKGSLLWDYSWVSGHCDRRTTLVCTVSLSLLPSVEKIRPLENSPQWIGLTQLSNRNVADSSC